MHDEMNGYDVYQVIEVIEMLSKSQGFYGRLFEEIMYMDEYEPDKFKVFAEIVEKQEFKDPVDVVMFFEQ